MKKKVVQLKIGKHDKNRMGIIAQRPKMNVICP